MEKKNSESSDTSLIFLEDEFERGVCYEIPTHFCSLANLSSRTENHLGETPNKQIYFGVNSNN